MSPAGHRPGAAHDHALRHERCPGAGDLRGAPAGALPPGADRRSTRVQRRDRAGIDAEIQQLLEAAHTRVRETLAQRALLESLGKLLIAHEVVDRNARSRGC